MWVGPVGAGFPWVFKIASVKDCHGTDLEVTTNTVRMVAHKSFKGQKEPALPPHSTKIKYFANSSEVK